MKLKIGSSPHPLKIHLSLKTGQNIKPRGLPPQLNMEMNLHIPLIRRRGAKMSLGG